LARVPPDAAVSGRFFVNFTNTAGHTAARRSTARIGRRRSARADLLNGAGAPAAIAQPFANHNGGNLVFGPDGCSISA
jgi:hypothetical protein